MYSFPNLETVVPCPVLTVASWPAFRFHRRQIGKHHCMGFLCGHKFSAYLLVKYQGRWLLDHTIRICLVQEIAELSSKCIPTTVRVSSCPTSLSTFGFGSGLHCCHSHRCVMVSYCLDLHFLVTFAIEHIICHLNVFVFLFVCLFFYFILLYNNVLVLPYIDMNPPWVYMSSQSWAPLLNVFFGSQFLFSSIFFFIPSQHPHPTFLQPNWSNPCQ